MEQDSRFREYLTRSLNPAMQNYWSIVDKRPKTPDFNKRRKTFKIWVWILSFLIFFMFIFMIAVSIINASDKQPYIPPSRPGGSARTSQESLEPEWIWVPFIFMAIFAIILIIIIITYKKEQKGDYKSKLVIEWENELAEAIQDIRMAIPKNIYKKYYEMNYPNSPLKFKGFIHSEINEGMPTMQFFINGNEVLWDIGQEVRTRSKGGSLYSLNYSLRLRTPFLDNFNWITLINEYDYDPNNTNFNKQNLFYSSSVDFNKRYKVFGANQMQMTRLFDPSVINYFNRANSEEYAGFIFSFGEGMAEIRNRGSWRMTNWESLLCFERFSLIGNDPDSFVEKIIEQIDRDFNYFYDVWKLFRPFDFYRIYSKN